VRHCDPMRRSGAKYFKEASLERTLFQSVAMRRNVAHY